jgi:hypothetical protein
MSWLQQQVHLAVASLPGIRLVEVQALICAWADIDTIADLWRIPRGFHYTKYSNVWTVDSRRCWRLQLVQP